MQSIFLLTSCYFVICNHKWVINYYIKRRAFIFYCKMAVNWGEIEAANSRMAQCFYLVYPVFLLINKIVLYIYVHCTVGWSDLAIFCYFRKVTGFCWSGIFLGGQFQKIYKFCSVRRTRGKVFIFKKLQGPQLWIFLCEHLQNLS